MSQDLPLGYSVLQYGAGRGDESGGMDEGGFDLTAEGKELDYHLLSTTSKNSTVQSVDQVENQA